MKTVWSPRSIVYLMLMIAVVLGAGFWLSDWIRYRLSHSITHDAFVDSHLVNVAPQVGGAIVGVYVKEQDLVKKGQLLARVDPAVFQKEVDVGKAKVAQGEAALAKAEPDLKLLVEEVPRRLRIAQRKLDVARAELKKAEEFLTLTSRLRDQDVRAAQAKVDAQKAALQLADEDYRRYGDLFRDGSVTERRYQEATRTVETAKAGMAENEARLAQARADLVQIAIADQQREAASQMVAEAEAFVEIAQLGDIQIEVGRKLVSERKAAVDEARQSLALAQTNLRFTDVTAPSDGVIAKKWRHVGDYARAGEPIFNIYNPDLMYITVNLEETRLAGVSPGNAAMLWLDAFREPFRGRVVWVGSASDANFSLLPRDVSAGEFTYVVQRIPTRIAIERDERWNLLKPGLSVEVAIEHGAGDEAWAREEAARMARIAGVEEGRP